jgi:hypothetical protein
MDEPDARTVDRGAPLVATPLRWLAFAVGEAAVVYGLGTAFIAIDVNKHALVSRIATGTDGTSHEIPGILPSLFFSWLVLVVVTYAMLRGEESRLTRELRTARTGSPAMRAMVLGRRERTPPLLRWLSTLLGTAAVFIADSDRTNALNALSASSVLMSGGRLALVRTLVSADADRSAGTKAMLDRCVETLRATSPTGNAEAERYRAHVHVKALLQLGDAEAGAALYHELAASKDEEIRVYAVWLRAWFEIDVPSTASDGEVRLALLFARAQGAADLAKKLEREVPPVSPLQPPPSAST